MVVSDQIWAQSKHFLFIFYLSFVLISFFFYLQKFNVFSKSDGTHLTNNSCCAFNGKRKTISGHKSQSHCLEIMHENSSSLLCITVNLITLCLLYSPPSLGCVTRISQKPGHDLQRSVSYYGRNVCPS